MTGQGPTILYPARLTCAQLLGRQDRLSGLLPDTLFQQKMPATIYFPFYAQIFPHCLKTGSKLI